MFGVVAFGAAAVADLIPHVAERGPAWLKSSFAATAAILGALDISFDLSNRARAHAVAKRRYFELWGDLRAGRKTPEEVRDCVDRYTAEEETPFQALYLGCWNRAQREIRGKDALHLKLMLSIVA